MTAWQDSALLGPRGSVPARPARPEEPHCWPRAPGRPRVTSRDFPKENRPGKRRNQTAVPGLRQGGLGAAAEAARRVSSGERPVQLCGDKSLQTRARLLLCPLGNGRARGSLWGDPAFQTQPRVKPHVSNGGPTAHRAAPAWGTPVVPGGSGSPPPPPSL